MYEPIKIFGYWRVYLNGKPVSSKKYVYAAECQELCNKLNKGDEE